MFTVRPHPPKGPSSAPFSSPGGAVVAFGDRFPALLLLLGLVFVFLPVYFCVRFSWVFALPAYRPWSFIFCLRLGRPSRVGGSAASSFSGFGLRFAGLLFPSCPSFFPGFRASVRFPSAFALGLLSALGPSPFFLSAFWGVFLPCNFFLFLGLLLSLYPLRFCSLLLGTSFFVLDSLFSCRSISLYFFIYFYLFRFVRLKDCGRGG